MKINNRDYPSDAWTVADAVSAACRLESPSAPIEKALWVTRSTGSSFLVYATVTPLPLLGLYAVHVDPTFHDPRWIGVAEAVMG